MDFGSWRRVYVGCSGTFRVEQVVNECFPDAICYGNDVSAVSCALGCAVTGKPFDLRFVRELDFLAVVNDKPPLCKLAALGIAELFAGLNLKTAYGQHVRRNILDHVAELLAKNLERLQRLADNIRIEDFYPGDFTAQIERAAAGGGGFVSFAPTRNGGADLPRKIAANTVWSAPAYKVWDPDRTPELIDRCREAGIPYAVYCDRRLEGCEPASLFEDRNGRQLYCYSQGRSSYRNEHKKCRPFAYRPIVPARLTAETRVTVSQVGNDYAAFLKTVYLAKGINFEPAPVNYFLFLDGMLAGCVGYMQHKFDRYGGAYLKCDFSLSRERKLSKLIALLATSRDLIAPLRRAWWTDVRTVSTTAFTHKAVSMKYRGVFTVDKRGDGYINYSSPVRERGVQDLYRDWWERYGKQAGAKPAAGH